jgi:hypothetical protein
MEGNKIFPCFGVIVVCAPLWILCLSMLDQIDQNQVWKTNALRVIEQISHDCEKDMEQTCCAMTVLCPSILIGWEVLERHMIGWEDLVDVVPWPYYVPWFFTLQCVNSVIKFFTLTWNKLYYYTLALGL